MVETVIMQGTIDAATLVDFQALLREEAGFLIGGATFLIIGILALLLAAVRREARNGLVLPFALMSIIWGLRFITRAPVVDIAVTVDPEIFLKFRHSLTYLITAPAFLLAIRIYGPGWRSSLLVMTGIATVFAVVCPILIFSGFDPVSLLHYFNVMALVGMAAVVGNMLRAENRRRPELRVLIIGGMISLIFIALENLGNLGVFTISRRMEWIGVAILYCTLFYMTIHHFFTVSQKLSNLRQELETARRIQTSILPQRKPDVAGLVIVTRYQPMTEVAGDFYDFSRLGEDRVGCLIADVSGHGVPAALVASMVKVAFQAQTAQKAEPADVLTGMNEMLGHRLEGQFVTAGYACLDLVEMRLKYSSAGHPPALIRRGNGGGIDSISAGGLILAPFPEAEYESMERPLVRGDRILMYTDGIIEATNANDEEFGLARTSDLLQDSRNLSAEDFADALLSAVDFWAHPGAGNLQDDDLTLMVIDVAE